MGSDVSGPACIYAIVHVKRGTVSYVHGHARVSAPGCFAVFLPPFTMVQASLERCDVTSLALAFRPMESDALPLEPVLLRTTMDPPPRSAMDIVSHLRRAGTTRTRIGRVCDPARLAARAKAIIDREYEGPLAIGRIAARLRMAPAVLSRSFREAYGMPPVRYRHQVRVMGALMRFADGAAPADVFQDVGFDDLSRFYKVFREVACGPPGSYRPVRSKNAKT